MTNCFNCVNFRVCFKEIRNPFKIINCEYYKKESEYEEEEKDNKTGL